MLQCRSFWFSCTENYLRINFSQSEDRWQNIEKGGMFWIYINKHGEYGLGQHKCCKPWQILERDNKRESGLLLFGWFSHLLIMKILKILMLNWQNNWWRHCGIESESVMVVSPYDGKNILSVILFLLEHFSNVGWLVVVLLCLNISKEQCMFFLLASMELALP